MTEDRTTVSKRLGVWAESAEDHRHIQARLSKFRRSAMPLSSRGRELAEVIVASRLDGILFYSKNAALLKTLLLEIEEPCPGCCRFVICSRKNESIFREWKGIPPAILEEDEKPEAWADRIDRAIVLNQWITRPEFRMILPRLRSIPSLPESHRRVVQALQNPDFQAETVAQLISRDVALTAQLLKIVNSAALGLAQPVHSIPSAITVLGVVRLQSLVMSAWAFFFADEKICPGFSAAAEWSHALTVAEAAEKMARERNASSAVAESAFITGILHDVGKVFLAANSADTYAGIISHAKKQGKPRWEAEKEVLGYTHAELGGCVLGLWGLDLSIVEAVSRHHDISLEDARELTLAKLLYDANRKVHSGEEEEKT